MNFEFDNKTIAIDDPAIAMEFKKCLDRYNESIWFSKTIGGKMHSSATDNFDKVANLLSYLVGGGYAAIKRV